MHPSNRLAIPLAIAFLLSTLIVSAEYYADITIDVDAQGMSIISGKSNHPFLAPGVTSELTSKSGSIWTLNLSMYDEFADYIYTVKLPSGAIITSIRTYSQYRIYNEDGRISITGTGTFAPIIVSLQYTILAPNTRTNEIYLTSIGFLIMAIIGGILYLLARKPNGSSNPIYNPDTLTDRQKQIIDILKKHKKPITQAQLEKMTGLPKSSLSRNIDSLAQRQIIVKESKGIVNIIYFTKE
jgi:uncharacterized membrane protein